jgi:hypothetical protein
MATVSGRPAYPRPCPKAGRPACGVASSPDWTLIGCGGDDRDGKEAISDLAVLRDRKRSSLPRTSRGFVFIRSCCGLRTCVIRSLVQEPMVPLSGDVDGDGAAGGVVRAGGLGAHTVSRTLNEIAGGGAVRWGGWPGAVTAARRTAWLGIEARHAGLPGVRIADRRLEGVTCLRLDATVVEAHSDKEGAEPNFKGFGHHPLLSYGDNTGERSNTTADHIAILDASIAALSPAYRRRLMVTTDGAGASRGLIKHLDTLAARPGTR